jgi:hypothetical protein
VSYFFRLSLFPFFFPFSLFLSFLVAYSFLFSPFIYTAEKPKGAIILRHVGWLSGVQGSSGVSLALEVSTIFGTHRGLAR